MFESQSVSEAAAFLDEKLPGWHLKIDVNKLDMQLGTRCILGQCYESWLKGCRLLGVNYETNNAFSRWASTEDWLKQINSRLNGTHIQEQVRDTIQNDEIARLQAEVELQTKNNRVLEDQVKLLQMTLGRNAEIELQKDELDLLYTLVHESFPNLSEHLSLKRKLLDLYDRV